jgi:hypothetical protein
MLYVFSTFLLLSTLTTLGQDPQQQEQELNFEAVYHNQYYEIDPLNKYFLSRQTIDIRNNSTKSQDAICFLIHPGLSIEKIGLKDPSGKEINIKNWQYSGTKKIYGVYDVPVIRIETEKMILPAETLLFNIEYKMIAQMIKEEPAQMYEFTVSPQASYAISPLIGNTPYFGGSTATPYRITLKYPEGNQSCVPGELISSDKECNFIIETYEHIRPNVPVFSCAPYKKIRKEDGDLAVEFYLYPTETYSDSMADEIFRVINLYFNTFGDNGTYTYKFATVGEYDSKKMNGENKGSTVYFPDFVSENYISGQEGRYDYLEFLSHEVYHNWNLFYVTWRDQFSEWFIEGGANFICAWAAEKIAGDSAGVYIRKKYIERFIREKGYESAHTLLDVEKTGTAEKALMYTYGALVWEQLNQKIGTEALLSGLRHFYDNHKFQEVSYQDLLNSISVFTSCDIKSFLNPWLNNNARILLSIADVSISKKDGLYETTVIIESDTNGDSEIITSLAYNTGMSDKMNKIPVIIKGNTGSSVVFTSELKPVQIQIDPDYLVPVINQDQMIWRSLKNN